MEELQTIYASIGNSDDRLTQKEWSEFVSKFVSIIRGHAVEVYGVWYSAPDSQWQNCCVGFAVNSSDYSNLDILDDLISLREAYRQDSVAWAIVERTAFV